MKILIQKILSYYLIHPLLFLLGFMLYFYILAGVTVSPDQVIRPIVIHFLLIYFFSQIGIWIFRDRDLVGPILTIFVLGLCVNITYFAFSGTASLAVITLGFVYAKVRKLQMKLSHVNLLLNFVSMVVVSVFFALPVSALRTFDHYKVNGYDLESVELEPSSGTMPDIYFIVLDGYVRSDVLQELYDFDNHELLQSLKEMGFIVPSNSRSNYPKTALSIPSTLNMDYIDAIAPDLHDSYFWWLMTPLIDQSRVRESLERIGYKSVSIMTDWNITDNRSTDIYYHPKPVMLNGFENYLLSATPIGALTIPLISSFASVNSNHEHHELGLYQFETLAGISNINGPKFIFAHIISPHPPFVTDSKGNFMDAGYPFKFDDGSDFPLSEDVYRRGYAEQVRNVNNQIIRLMKVILQESKTPPIIIVQADHGSGLLTDFASVDNTCLRERFSIFAAYYLPGMDDKSIPEDITSVNIFRIIFNQYFGTDLPLLKRVHYYPNSALQIYDVKNVTSIVDTCSTP